MIRYTTDGTAPTDASTPYTAPVQVATTTTFEAATFRTGWQTSTVTTATYTLNYGTLTAPTISPANGTYVSSVDVTMTAAPSSTIRYTLDGTDPTPASAVYTGPVSVEVSSTVKARAFRIDYATSAATTATYTVAVADPELSLPAGEYPGGQTVTLLDATSGAVLRYTITRADPTTADPILTPGATLVLGNFLVKVRAYKAGCTSSQVVSASYTVSGSVSAPAVAAGNGFSVVLASDGTVWAWGANGSGQLGDGSNTSRPFPARVAGLNGIGSVAAGTTYAFSLAQNGLLQGWGGNQGYLGDGTSTNRSRPVAVTGVTDGRFVASRASHSATVRSDGSAWSWGTNYYGELGDGTTTARNTPVQVIGLTGAVAVATGQYAGTALTGDGTVWGWGQNTYGQVGDGTTANRATPVQVAGLSDIVAVAAGIGHRLALKADGTVWTWGLNSSGQLGDGTRTNRPSPVQVAGLSGVVRIAAGGWHSFAVTDDGTLWGWGGNGYGQLGDGTATDRSSPVAVAGLSGVVAIGASTAHSVAVTTDGTVWSWGRNQDGELGDGTTIWHATPTAISGPGMNWRVATPVLSLASGTYQTEQTVTITCSDPEAVLHYTTTGLDPTESDTVIASGGTMAAQRSLTLKVNGWKPGSLSSVVASAAYELKVVAPVLTPASGAYAAPVSVGGSTSTPGSTLRITLDGTEPGASSPVFTPPLSLEATATVKVRAEREGWTPSDTAVASYSITVTASDLVTIAPNGGAFAEPPYVWLTSERATATIRYTLDGTDPTFTSPRYESPIHLTLGTTLKARLFEVGYAVGGVATATFVSSDAAVTPAPVVSPAGGVFTTQRSVAVSAPVDAVLRYTTNGLDPGESDTLVPVNRTVLVDRSLVLKVRAWQPDLLPSPVRRADFAITGAVAAGTFFSLALAGDGTVWAWGSNQYGQLGDGTSTYRFTPIQVPGLTGVIAVAAGSDFALVLKADGTVWSWGQNGNGQLGDGTTTIRHSPVQVAGLSDVAAIAAGEAHALAAKADGTVWSWGRNDTGQLGDGTTTNRHTPAALPALTGVSAVSAGHGFSLALETGGASEGRVWAWGKNDKGQVGDGATATRLVPVRVPGAPTLRSIAAGADWTAAVASDGQVWTWGGNAAGQLGTGFGPNRLGPAPIVGLPPISSASAGDAFGLAIDRDGVAWGWGDNGAGQFGMSIATCAGGPCEVPVRLPWNLPLGVAPGAWFTIVIATDGSVWSAGANASGQLGTGTSQPSEVLVPASGLSLVADAWLTTDEDGDGLSCWREFLVGTDPLNADTNGNGVPDGVELAAGLDPRNTDSDGDGVPDVLELGRGTDPFVADTDGDGVNDRLDAFPLDRTRWQAPSPDPNDHTPPTITLTLPTTARRIR